MASTHQPLLNTSKQSTNTSKILFYCTLAISILVISTVLLVPNLIQTNQTIINDPSHICLKALNPESCRNIIASETTPDAATPHDQTTLLKKHLMNQIHRINTSISHAKTIRNRINGKREQGVLSDCLELMDLSIELTDDSIIALNHIKTSRTSHADAQSWLSAVLTNHVTCSDELINNTLEKEYIIRGVLDELISGASASLAMLTAIVPKPGGFREFMDSLRGELPYWIGASDRKLLMRSGNAIQADLTVAKDGSGDYENVADAVAAAPTKSKTRYVIYVKKGTYKENVQVESNKWNLMIVGDGMDITIISGDLNVDDGSTTYNSATLAAVARGFILQDIRIENTAGPQKHQAVALRVGADQSVINRCRLDAFQDTLYTHSQRQFYRDCYITGTVDFIFGNAAVVFQRSKLAARRPMSNQQNMVTAQGRTDPNQATGTSIQDCEVIPSSDLEPVKTQYKTYLGRPWKNYSRTVVMQSSIDDHIDPAGWAPWSGDFALDTLYYGEYMNRGPGAGTSQRVTWPGFHVIKDRAEAMKFTVKELIQGDEWLDSTGVSYTAGLL